MKRVKTQSGFTILEVVIITPILMVTVIGLLSFLFTMYSSFIQKNEVASMQVAAQAVVFNMQEDMLNTTAFSSTTNSNASDSHRPVAGWQHATDPPTLILSSASYTGPRQDTSRQQVYMRPGGPNTCTPFVSQSTMETYPKAYNNIIYYVKDNTLYKRILTPNSPTCGTGYQVQSCPSASANATCPADKVMATDVSDFDVTYLREDNSTTTVPEQANRVTITMTFTRTVAAEEVSTSASVTLKRLGE